VRQQAQTETAKAGGRERQKNRTRRALVAAAAELVRDGHNPTVAEVAEAADVSRATAYRYFPTQEMLLAEVALFAVGGPLFPTGEETAALSPPDAVGRLVRGVAEWAYENERPLRTLLRLSLDPSTGVRRPGHRVGWIADALAPVRAEIDPATCDKLSAALTLFLGIDPVVVMTDIASVSREQALDALEWSARTLVQGALAGGGSAPRAAAGSSTSRSSRSRPESGKRRTAGRAGTSRA
jgi:AcrR family transcriptional regulator